MRSTSIAGPAFFLAATLFAGSAIAGPAETLEAECHAQLNMSDAACACIGNSAVDQLNDQQLEVLIASIQESDQAMNLRAALPLDQAMQVANFMQSAPATCSQAG